MAFGARQELDAPADERATPDTGVKAVRTRPGRLVFLEDGNNDGWIATDDAVVPSR